MDLDIQGYERGRGLTHPKDIRNTLLVACHFKNASTPVSISVVHRARSPPSSNATGPIAHPRLTIFAFSLSVFNAFSSRQVAEHVIIASTSGRSGSY
jgi:hypothetical protein